ncbi:MAG: DUF4102 domain-containing protein, partial [Alphaproteobacteria bacterium]|nr:DUF4102 domain-containing protein [Alphaproteobacteria bacterium]
MARHRETLTTRSIAAALKRPGMHIDGQGLYLRVALNGNASWVYRYRAGGRCRDMGLGPYPVVSLASARELALQQRRLRINGDDPLSVRRAAAADKTKTVFFREATEQYIAAKAPGWKGKDGGKSRRQWEQSIRDYAFPVLGAVPVQAVDLGLVLKVLEPIWTEKPETANRVRGRIE